MTYFVCLDEIAPWTWWVCSSCTVLESRHVNDLLV
jgi:hypothetical protein